MALVAVKGHALIFVLTVLYWLAVQGALATLGQPRISDFTSFALGFIFASVPILFLALVTVKFIRLAMVERPERPTLALAREMKDFLTDRARLLHGLPLVVSLSIVIECYTDLKFNIPALAPFSWDAALMEMDRVLHFGRHPWEWLQPLLGYAPVTFVINLAYNLWFIVMWAFWVMLAFARHASALRTQFFISFILLWAVGGSALAALFSSAGPCYYSALGLSPDPYLPLMEYLRGVHEMIPLWAVDTQTLLWSAHTGEQNIVGGISAMPSMHNASTLLFTLVAWQLDRRLGWTMIGYSVLIFLGSVHLGWHYAVDAYLGWAVAALAWWLAGRLARWNENLPWTRTMEQHAATLRQDRPSERT